MPLTERQFPVWTKISLFKDTMMVSGVHGPLEFVHLVANTAAPQTKQISFARGFSSIYVAKTDKTLRIYEGTTLESARLLMEVSPGQSASLTFGGYITEFIFVFGTLSEFVQVLDSAHIYLSFAPIFTQFDRGLVYLYNDAKSATDPGYDLQRNNTEIQVFGSSERTGTTTRVIFNYNARGAIFVIRVSNIVLTPQITPTIQGTDPTTGQNFTILTGAAMAATGTQVLRVYPGLVAVPNAVANDILPRRISFLMTHLDADPITYAVGALFVL